MDGIILVNKDKGYTSHDVINVLRGILKTKKLGHTGTLDPDATGVLVVGVNKGTKIMKYLNNDEKTYQATVLIGQATDTLDKTGVVIAEKAVTKLTDVDEVIATFNGDYTQTPPMYSAVKYKGKRLYEYARKGITIEDIPSRTIKIFDLKRTSEITYENNFASFDYTVHSSKGLYVRTLSYDIGKKLGYPAHNKELHRIKAGKFNVKDSFSLKEIEAGNYQIISLANALSHLNKLVVPKELAHHVKNGMAISLRYFKEPTLTRLVDEQDTLLAIYDKHPTEPKMKAINVF